MPSPARTLFSLAAAAAATAALAAGPPVAAATAPAHYDHIFVIVEENHSFTDVIGNPAAPNLNALASMYGLATSYFGVTHPSEPNYVALLGGSTFGVASDDAYYVNRVHAPSLISELDRAHVSWKAYLQSSPHPGYQGICYPANCNGEPDKDPLYASKHNAIPNFTTSLNPADWARQVPIGQLGGDLRSGHVPAFGWVIPDECRDEHGDPPYCIDSGNPGGGDPQDQRLVSVGDRYLGQLVAQITGAGFWARGNNAIDVVYDEGDGNAHGGGRVANIVITSHGPRHATDPAFYNHYSLLQTIQRNFGLPCLRHTCDTAHVKPLTPLLAVTGSAARAFKPLPVPTIATPTPAVTEPVTYSRGGQAGAGWTVRAAPVLGTNDNSYGAVAAASATDLWAAGNFLPDTAPANQDATLGTAAHFNGTRWVPTQVPHVGPNYNTLFGVAAAGHQAWAVGVALNRAYQAHSLIDAWDGSAWHVASAPRLRTQRDILFSAVALSPRDVWAVGEQQASDGTFGTLTEHWDGTAWSVVPSPDPGSSGNELFGVAAGGPHDVWAVGQRHDRRSDTPLAEHWDGRRWVAASLPTAGVTGGLLQAVTVHGSQVWAVGQSDDATHQARPLVEHLRHGSWTAQLPAGLGSGFSNVTGVAVARGTVWLVGSALDAASGDQLTLVARHNGSGWQQVAAPNPGTGDRILGGITVAGGTAWAVGAYDTSARTPLIESHR
jgi:Phosphoesterase family